MAEHTQAIVDFLFEAGILSKTPRSGFHFLGSGEQSVAEHINRVVFIGYVLASLEADIDMTKVLKMCLLHDLTESRISDLNYVHQKYTERHEAEAIADVSKPLPFGDDIKDTVTEYEERQSREALLAKDADNLEWILSLKEQMDIGNSRAGSWLPSAVKRLKSDSAKKIAEKILTTNSDHWWFADQDDDWWVNRNKHLNI